MTDKTKTNTTRLARNNRETGLGRAMDALGVLAKELGKLTTVAIQAEKTFDAFRIRDRVIEGSARETRHKALSASHSED